MIVLDTNVVSEIYKPSAAPPVAAWFSIQARRDLFVCAPVMAEVRYGVQRLAAGRKRDELDARYQRTIERFRSQILSFDLRAVEAFADIVITRERAGTPIGAIDAQIAAIAKARGASVATRDVADFAGCGIDVIDPWAYSG
jgi:predicted nucleic acid-binding protein